MDIPDQNVNQGMEFPTDASCLFCKKTDVPSLKPMQEKQWNTAKQASIKRNSLKKDKFNDATSIIQASVTYEQYWYHSRCLSDYSAVKKKREPATQEAVPEPPTKVTRSKSPLGPSVSSSTGTGCFGNKCLFCPFQKRRSGSSQLGAFEIPRPISTRNSAAAIIDAAKNQDSDISHKILAIGDLLAKEAKCHDSCKREFIKPTTTAAQPAPEGGDALLEATATRQNHSKAFEELSQFLKKEIILNHKPFMVSTIFNLYRAQYLAVGGTMEQLEDYPVQALVNKVKKITGIQVHKESNKRGLFVFPSSMAKDEAQVLVRNSSLCEEEIRYAAMTIRAEIASLPKTKVPSPTSVHTLKETAPAVPPLTDLFFRTIMNGLESDGDKSTVRKITAMGSDAVFNCSRGSVRPWKNTALGLGMSSLTGSKTVLTVLNRQGHAISYPLVKELETEIAYSCASEGQETPSGLVQSELLATATAWDNYDVAIETLDGKNTLHVTVGICYQNFHPVLHAQPKETGMIGTVAKPRRSFEGPVKEIPPCYSNLKLAKFQLEQATKTSFLEQDDIDFMWIVKSCKDKLPLLNGYYSLFVPDTLPKTVIAYMDPISQPPTRNDVVQETMVRSLKVAAENNQEYAVVSYDLAVALKAYSIQAVRTPEFDKLIILLGVFHLELAIFGALGTYIDDSGIEYILTEYGILAEGSLNGFLKGKFYNRCARIHQLVAAVLEKAIFQRYLEDAPQDTRKKLCEGLLTDSGQHNLGNRAPSEHVHAAMHGYEAYFQGLIEGSQGKLAQFWAIYVYIVNRVYRLLQRAVRTNDLDVFLRVLPCTIELFFALNRPNYARWGSLFLDKLSKMPHAARKVLEEGAFSTRRTNKSYSRSPIDLTLEQTVNRDAASSATGITSFTNSESAFRRWNISLTQRSMAVSEMKDMCDIQPGETPANQLKKGRIIRDNRDMEELTKALEDTCNPFKKDAPAVLVNIATGKVTAAVTSDYLTQVLERGRELRKKFTDECATDDKRFLKTIPRFPVQNFATGNLQKKSSSKKKALDTAEGVRDAFGYLLTAAAKSDEKPDLKMILSHPITQIPLPLAHADGSMNKTEKAAFTKILEGKQQKVLDEKSIGRINASMFDGGLLMHEILPSHNKSTYSKIGRDFMVKLASAPGDEVHLLLDRYITPSIKDPERQKRGGIKDNTYQITGPEQQQKQKGRELLNDACFKEQFGRFLLMEAQKAHYSPVIGEKTIYISHGGDCIRIENRWGQMEVNEPEEMQGKHEEADTLIGFHIGKVKRGTVIVRSSDTDVAVVLTALAPRKPDISIIMDYGSGNTRRFIDISSIARELEKQQPGLCDALPGFHSLTGCDFTSSFYKKGKKKPFEILTTDQDNQYLGGIQSLNSSNVDYESLTAYVCHIYGAKRRWDIDEARYDSFMKMTGGNKVLSKVKKVNCSSLPPCKKSLHKHIQRANFVAMTWHNADQAVPNVKSPLDFGWKDVNGAYQPVWFEGPAVPGGPEDQVKERQNEVIPDATSSSDEYEDGMQKEAEEDSRCEWSGDSGDESETD